MFFEVAIIVKVLKFKVVEGVEICIVVKVDNPVNVRVWYWWNIDCRILRNEKKNIFFSDKSLIHSLNSPPQSDQSEANLWSLTNRIKGSGNTGPDPEYEVIFLIWLKGCIKYCIILGPMLPVFSLRIGSIWGGPGSLRCCPHHCRNRQRHLLQRLWGKQLHK